jgi:arylsulfatase A-like enzyme
MNSRLGIAENTIEDQQLQTNRRDLIKAGALAIAASSHAARATVQHPKLPNILWLVSEDNNPFIRAYGDRLATTPNIDALAAKGVLFRNAYSTAPTCAPSRYAILTGMYAESNGPANHMRARAAFPKFLHTYPELLRSIGYHCTNNGKTDYNAEIPGARIWNENNSKNAHWRSRAAGAPFMAVFNQMTTHESQLFGVTPGRVKAEQVRVPAYLPDTTDVRTDIASYYNLVEKMDAQVGQRLAELEADGLSEDTIIFYFADNGGVLPRTKHFVYDEGLRVPLVVYVPPKWQHLAVARPGTIVETPTSLVDLAPTLLSIAGLAAPKTMHGQAFLGRNASPPRRYAFGGRDRMDERYDMVRTVTDGRYRYIRNYMPYRPAGMHEAYPWHLKSYQDWDRAHRAGRLLPAQSAFFKPKSYEELYDLEVDPDQMDNRIADPAYTGRLRELRRALDRHMVHINDNGFIPEGSPVQGYEASRAVGAYPLRKIMALAQAGARGEPRKLDLLRNSLLDANEVVRFWAATGLVILGQVASPVATELARLASNDPSPQVRVTAAEALIRLGKMEAGMSQLSRLAAAPAPDSVRLMAINALSENSEAARAILPLIEQIAQNDPYDHAKDAAFHLAAVLNRTYDPGRPAPERSNPKVRRWAME